MVLCSRCSIIAIVYFRNQIIIIIITATSGVTFYFLIQSINITVDHLIVLIIMLNTLLLVRFSIVVNHHHQRTTITNTTSSTTTSSSTPTSRTIASNNNAATSLRNKLCIPSSPPNPFCSRWIWQRSRPEGSRSHVRGSSSTLPRFLSHSGSSSSSSSGRIHRHDSRFFHDFHNSSQRCLRIFHFHHCPRVIHPQLHPGICQYLWRSLPRRMNVLRRETGQHRQPSPHIIPIRIEFLRF